MFRKAADVVKGAWWWRSWIAATSASVVLWVLHVGAVIDDEGLERPALYLGYAIAWGQVAPAFYVAAGFVAFSTRVVKGWPPIEKHPLDASAAYFASCVVAVGAWLVAGENLNDSVSALMAANAVAPLTLGVFPTMLLQVWASWWASRCRSRLRLAIAIALASAGWVAAIWAGLMLPSKI